MKKKIEIIPSGIKLVDTTWGGFYRGGTYLLLGSRKSGRTLLALQFAMECAKQREVCLFFTSMKPKDLMIQAASIDFDIQEAMNQNLIIVVRVPVPTDLSESNPDRSLVEYINDIVNLSEQYQPSKIIFDEFTHFIGFNNLNLLADTFSRTIEEIEESGTTSVFVLGDPATQRAKDVIDILANNSTGVLYLQKNEDDKKTHGGKIIITPNIGHTEGQFTSEYSIEPYKGITFNIKNAPGAYIKREHNAVEKVQPKKKGRGYTTLDEIETPDTFSFSNVYNENDFNLILNNQIALYKSTGQSYAVLTFKIEEENSFITVNQLLNAVRLASDRKDKICKVNDKVLVLVTKEEDNYIPQLISKIKSNLPVNSSEDLQQVLKIISVMVIKSNDQIKDANSILEEVMEEEFINKVNRINFF